MKSIASLTKNNILSSLYGLYYCLIDVQGFINLLKEFGGELKNTVSK